MDKNWSMNLEGGEYESDVNLLIEDAIQAVKQTVQGFYVNLVTPQVYGNPEEYLKAVLDDLFKESIRHEYIDHCGCGGYVYRVWKI